MLSNPQRALHSLGSMCMLIARDRCISLLVFPLWGQLILDCFIKIFQNVKTVFLGWKIKFLLEVWTTNLIDEKQYTISRFWPITRSFEELPFIGEYASKASQSVGNKSPNNHLFTNIASIYTGGLLKASVFVNLGATTLLSTKARECSTLVIFHPRVEHTKLVTVSSIETFFRKLL